MAVINFAPEIVFGSSAYLASATFLDHSIAPLSDGRFAVVWQDYNTDGFSQLPQGAIYNPDGSIQVSFYCTPVPGDVFRNTPGTSIVALSNGGFVVAFKAQDNTTTSSGIYVEIFNNDGIPSDSTFLAVPAGSQPFLAPLSNGNFVVLGNTNSNDTGGVNGTILSSTGVQVATLSVPTSMRASAIALPGGGFAIEYLQGDGGIINAYVEMFGQDGTSLGGPRKFASGANDIPGASVLASGNTVFTWAHYDSSAGTSSVFCCVLKSDGTTEVAPFPVTAGVNTSHPVVAALPSGQFLIVWTTNDPGTDGSNSAAVHGQLFSASGSPIDPSFIISSPSSDYFSYPNVTVLSDSRIIVDWTDSSDSTNQIEARILSVSNAGSLSVNTAKSTVVGTIAERASLSGSTALDRAIGRIVFTDKQTAARPTATVYTHGDVLTCIDSSGNLFNPTAAQTAAIESAFSITAAATNTNNGVISWTYSIPDKSLDFLGAGETVTLVAPVVVDDHSGGTVTQDVAIKISGANDRPVATADSAIVVEGSALAVNASKGVLANDTDPDVHDILSVSAVNGLSQNVGQAIQGARGSLTLNADGSYRYSETSNTVPAYGAKDVFTYTVSDGHGSVSTSRLTINITPNDVLSLSVPASLVTYQGIGRRVGGVKIIDNTPGETFTVTVTASGKLWASGMQVIGSGTSLINVSGSLSQVNKALASLTYTGPPGTVDTIFISTNDKNGSTASSSILVARSNPQSGLALDITNATTEINQQYTSGHQLYDSGQPFNYLDDVTLTAHTIRDVALNSGTSETYYTIGGTQTVYQAQDSDDNVISVNSSGYVNPTKEVRTSATQAANIQNIDQCVALVQALEPDVGATSTWFEHEPLSLNGVLNPSIAVGTPIATFDAPSHYSGEHAAIFLGAAVENGASGFLMLDQYVGRIDEANLGLPLNQHAEIRFHSLANTSAYFSIV